jgi:hypothetical protein
LPRPTRRCQEPVRAIDFVAIGTNMLCPILSELGACPRIEISLDSKVLW